MPVKSTLLRLMLPPQSRTFPGKRWVQISLRTAHLIGTAGIGGAFLYGAPTSAWLPYFWVLLLSGVAMVLLQLWSNAVWLLQLRGLAILAKLALLALVPLWPQAALPVCIAVVTISGVISHAPGNTRYYSLWHGRRIEAFPAPSVHNP
jgi:hypothetical protein